MFCACTVLVPADHIRLEKAPGPLKVDLPKVVSHHVGARKEQPVLLIDESPLQLINPF